MDKFVEILTKLETRFIENRIKPAIVFVNKKTMEFVKSEVKMRIIDLDQNLTSFKVNSQYGNEITIAELNHDQQSNKLEDKLNEMFGVSNDDLFFMMCSYKKKESWQSILISDFYFTDSIYLIKGIVGVEKNKETVEIESKFKF